MERTKIFQILLVLFAEALCLGPGAPGVGLAEPLGTAFTYQGQLIDSNEPADGLYDFQFKLYDDASNGNQLGDDVNKSDVGVVDGYFTMGLDFNDANAFNGEARWLDIGIRPGAIEDPNLYTVLSPRQKISPTPYALHAKTARGGSATLLVAASNAPSYIKARADYVCTGTSDQDTIRAAYLALPDFHGGKLEFTVGDFNCDNTIDINDDNIPCSLEGVSFLSYWPQPNPFQPKGTVFNLQANKQLLNFGFKHDAARCCYWSCGTIKNIWFNGNGYGDTNTSPLRRNSTVLIGNEGDVEISNCMFYRMNSTFGLHIINHATWVNSCNFEYNRNSIYIGSYCNWIKNCQFVGNYDTDYADIEVCYFRNWIENCWFYWDTKKPINLGTNANDIHITGNIFHLWASLSTDAAITLGASDSNIVITTNEFSGGGYGDYGIYGTGNYNKMVVTGNQFNGVAAKNIYLIGTLTNCVIEDNVGAEETLGADNATATPYETTHIAGTAPGKTLTLPDGIKVGCQKTFDMIDASNPVTLSVTHHVLGNPYTYTFDDISDYARFEWSGKAWITVVNNGL